MAVTRLLTADQAVALRARLQPAAVIGAGLMGRGIAAVLASGGLDVMLATQPDRLDESVAAVRSHAAARGAEG
jgi:3-hydroxyacyl-CoA dehydrogenase